MFLVSIQILLAMRTAIVALKRDFAKNFVSVVKTAQIDFQGATAKDNATQSSAPVSSLFVSATLIFASSVDLSRYFTPSSIHRPLNKTICKYLCIIQDISKLRIFFSILFQVFLVKM